MPRVQDLAGYLGVGAIAALALVVWSLYPRYNYHEKRAADKGRPKDEG